MRTYELRIGKIHGNFSNMKQIANQLVSSIRRARRNEVQIPEINERNLVYELVREKFSSDEGT
jgi:hypothetical protein